MSGNGAADGADTPTGHGSLLDRRSYLKAAGVAAASLPLVSGTASALERRGIRFQTVVDMVADAGCDPTGEEPCDAKLKAAADDYTLLRFPEGEYFFREKNVILDRTNLGLIGEGDVRFSVPSNYNEKLVVIDYGTGLLFENIDVDLTAPGATPALHLGAGDDLQVHDVELIGEGVHPNSDPIESGHSTDFDNPNVRNGILPIVRDPAGTGVVENFVAHNHGLMGTYTRVGVWVGASHKGTITLRDCNVEGFPGNGLYCSRTNGVVQVEGGLFRNNDISQVRIGSEGSYVRDATIEVDLDAGRSPNPREALNTRGVRLESGGPGQARGGTVENCDVTISSTPNSSGGVVAARTHGDFTLTNSRIRVDVDRIRGVNAKVPDGGLYDTPGRPHGARLDGVSITGDAAGTEAIGIVGRDGSVIRNCCLQQGGPNRDGVRLTDATNCTVEGSTLNVTGKPVVLDGARAATGNNLAGGTCPLPDRASTPGGSDPPTPDPDDGATARSDQHTLSIEGGSTNTVVSYQFSTSGSVEKTTAMGASVDDEDRVSSSEVTGATAGGTDSFAFDGRITSFDADGAVTTYIDGEPIDDPTTFLPNTLSIEGGSTNTVVSYRFSASGPVRKSTARGASVDSEDTISDGEVTGATAGGTDSFAFAGSITSFDADGDVTVYRNGTAIDPVSLRPDTLTLEGGHTDEVVNYAFSTDGSVAKSDAMGASVTGEDSVSGTEATGALAGGRDSYAVTGAITTFDADGPLTVYTNGEEADPERYLTDVLSIEGGRTDAVVSYSLTVNGYVEKTDANGASVDDEDTTTGKTATGALAGGTDSFAFSGNIANFEIDGDATVTRNGTEIDPAAY